MIGQQEDVQNVPGVDKGKGSVKREIIEWIKALAVALVVVFLVRTFLFTMIRVDGRSMQETLHNNDRLAVTIIDFKINGPRRGDIIICTYPGADHLCVKRVIGMPGDTLEIREGVTYIDGEAYEEPYVTHPLSRDFYGPIALAEDQYFVMGDNRSNSKDSRDPSVGLLKKSDMSGKARLRVWPLDDFTIFE